MEHVEHARTAAEVGAMIGVDLRIEVEACGWRPKVVVQIRGAHVEEGSDAEILALPGIQTAA